MKNSGVWFAHWMLIAAAIIGSCTGAAWAQPAPLATRDVIMQIDSGVVANDGPVGVAAPVYFTQVTVPEAPWVRLKFDQLMLSGDPNLGTGSYIQITSVRDGAVQRMDARHLADWGNTSAYFNGDTVIVEIYAFAGTGANRLSMTKVWADDTAIFESPASICGETDDRVLSADPRQGRLAPVGCTAWLIDTGNCANRFLTAGHCIGAGATGQMVWFNVPLSTPAGIAVAPPPEDQFPVLPDSIQSTGDAGTGLDAAQFFTGANANTGLHARVHMGGEAYALAAAAPNETGQEIRITGYGQTSGGVGGLPLDQNGVQKTGTGPYAGLAGTTITHETDTTGGNSGSPVVTLPDGLAIGIHTHAGCVGTVPVGSNQGTAIEFATLQGYLSNPLGPCAPMSPPWTVINLHPAGATNSLGINVDGGQQVGRATLGGVNRASLWSGTAGSWVDLHPGGATSSLAWGVAGGQQVGSASVGGVNRASLWSGTAASWVNLTPAGATESGAYGVSGGQQVGYAIVAGVWRASLWSGTAASWVNLAPAGATHSEAFGVGGGVQVGYVQRSTTGGFACMWSGTAASYVNLHPAGAAQSFAYGVDGNMQVGFVGAGSQGTQLRASLWSGTAASWVDLHPAQATHSLASGGADGQQVGMAQVGGTWRASLWSGTAASWVDLHSFLPPGFSSSTARRIWTNGTTTIICGEGDNTATGRTEALLWTRQVCSVASIASQPPGVATCPTGTAAFCVTAAGTGPFTYQWQWEPTGPGTGWVNLAAGNNAAAGGVLVVNAANVGAATLQVSPLAGYTNFAPRAFRCVVTNACGSATSEAATLTVCPLDYNCDSIPNPDDLGDFITDYYTPGHIPGPGGYAVPCAENAPPYDAGYKAAYTPDQSGQCTPPFPDNLGDYITDYFAGVCS
ncbi:MAG: hypothetical protein ACKVS8_13590 [Phycisphaerales bacterium]